MKIRRNGFTLLEVMMSMAILALVSLGVASGLSAAIRAWERGEKDLDAYQRKRILYERLFSEMSGTIHQMGQNEDDDNRRMVFDGDTDSLSFVTTADSMAYAGYPLGLKEVFIRVEPGDGLTVSEALFSNRDFFNRDRGVTYILDPFVREIGFRYFYYPASRYQFEDMPTEGEWLDQWGPEHIELYESVEEDLDGTRVRNREMRMNIPVAIEMKLSVWNPETDEVEDWQPIIIPLKDARVIGVSLRWRQRTR
ncbi:prepilin-type N-terminal cleavage/methylation domain-containing protein [bacterium]|nr:prepilin-type N-terminal cleavage/methylation domain-containing protein [candidate division CSSED10-310 bacterium]